MWPSVEYPQDIAPRNLRSAALCRRGCAQRTPARSASSTPAGNPPPGSRLRLCPRAYPAGGRSNGRGISRPSARSSTGSGRRGAPPAPFPESARP